LARGQRLTEILKQPNYEPMSVDQQVLIIYAASNGYMDEVPVDQAGRYESELHGFMGQRYPDVVSSIVNEKQITKDNEEKLKGALEDFKNGFADGSSTGLNGAANGAATNGIPASTPVAAVS